LDTNAYDIEFLVIAATARIPVRVVKLERPNPLKYSMPSLERLRQFMVAIYSLIRHRFPLKDPDPIAVIVPYLQRFGFFKNLEREPELSS
jgi:hypothetical protein